LTKPDLSQAAARPKISARGGFFESGADGGAPFAKFFQPSVLLWKALLRHRFSK